MKERIFQFGSARSLFGITSEPTGSPDPVDRPALIFLNAGLINRVGPNRMYVSMARRAANAGHIALRFDFAGSGDSRPHVNRVGLEDRAKGDTLDAMNDLQSRKAVDKFILIGLCSGADDALRIARQDPRVVGACCIDVATYTSLGYDIHRYSRRLLRPQSWFDLLSGRSDIWKMLRRAKSSGKGVPEPAMDWNVVDADELVDATEELAARNCRTLIVLSGGSPSLYNYRKHWRKRLAGLEKAGDVQVKIFKEADHTFTLIEHRTRLEQELLSWLATFTPQ